jgi:hypothetical protein
MSEQPKPSKLETRVPNPRKEKIIFTIGHISLGQQERRLDDLHAALQLLEQMSQ